MLLYFYNNLSIYYILLYITGEAWSDLKKHFKELIDSIPVNSIPERCTNFSCDTSTKPVLDEYGVVIITIGCIIGLSVIVGYVYILYIKNSNSNNEDIELH